MPSSQQSIISQFFRRNGDSDGPGGRDEDHFEAVFCPLCSISITNLTNGLRNVHVNKCLEKGFGSSETANGGVSGTSVKRKNPVDEEEDDDDDDVVVLEDNIGVVLDIDIADSTASTATATSTAITTTTETTTAAAVTNDTGTDIDTQTVNEEPATKRAKTDKHQHNSATSATKTKSTSTSTSATRSKSSSTRTSTATGTVASATKSKSTTQRPRPNPPFYKVLELNNKRIAVDAFCYGSISGVSRYFLTHFHSDHYGGLSKSWSHGEIYCTAATARLCELHLQVNSKYLKPVAMDEWIMVENGVEAKFMDANHCPGSSIILFRAPDKTILHTGDFRASSSIIERLKPIPLDIVYLDTTYLSPTHCFPSQQDVITACGDYVSQLCKGTVSSLFAATIDRFFGSNSGSSSRSSRNKPLVLVGTYTIGKERLAIHIAELLGSKIFAQRSKKRTLLAIDDPQLTNLLTDDGWESSVHLVSMRDLSWENLQLYYKPLSKTFSHCVAFVPTGWNFRPKQQSLGETPPFKMGDMAKTRQIRGKIHICRVPYSEHSSYSELHDFCTSLTIGRVVPTVWSGQSHNLRMQRQLDQWISRS